MFDQTDLDDEFATPACAPQPVLNDDDDFDSPAAPCDDDDFSDAGKHREADFYPTPADIPLRFFNAFNERTGAFTRLLKHAPSDWFLDPCAGGDRTVGKLAKMPYVFAAMGMNIPYERIVACDLREESPAQFNGTNYLTTPVSQFIPKRGMSQQPYIIASNPPFSLAQEFVDKALGDVCEYGYVALLLRLNFLGSLARAEWWQGMPIKPQWIFIESKRPSFSGDGKTDATEYAHFVWWKNPKIDNRTTLVWIQP